MGLFSRKEAKSSRHAAHRPRPSVSSEAQAASLRVRARRRLAGAVALVLAAVIVLPMLLDSAPRPVPAGIEIAVPERNAPFNPQLSQPPTTDPATTEVTAAAQEPATGQGSDPAVGNAATDPSGQKPAAASESQGVAKPAVTAGSASTVAKPEAKPLDSGAVPPSPPKTDQTAVALAILEGKAAPAAPSSSGGFVVQVASYGSESDAKARVEKLKSQGISNAFLETASVNGKPTFRMRVGPFDSRTAAQAAQARLRTLGYENGFITTK